MKEIDQFKQENGNVNYSTKELVGGLHKKMDRVIDSFHDLDKKASKSAIWITSFKYMMGGVFTALGYLIFIKP